jgi:hypothetical protein
LLAVPGRHGGGGKREELRVKKRTGTRSPWRRQRVREYSGKTPNLVILSVAKNPRSRSIDAMDSSLRSE